MKGDEKLWAILNDKLDLLRGMGQLPEAIRVAESAAELARRAFPPGHSCYALSLKTLGELYDQTGDSVAATKVLAKAHCLLEAGEQPDRRAIYSSARRLAFLSEDIGEASAAIPYYEQAIVIGMTAGDVPYSELGPMLNNLALLFGKFGREKEAEPFYLQALEASEMQLGPEHADVASILNNLAVFYTNQRRFTEAERMHLRALAIREKLLPPTHSDIAQSKCNLAVVYHSRGDYGRAAELYKESLYTWEETMRNPPPDYEIMASNYADLLRALGKARQAKQLEERAKKHRRV